jgi:hypothetical protein
MGRSAVFAGDKFVRRGQHVVVRAFLVGCLLAAGPAAAEVRFALLIGANAGWSNDRPLRHAESDAERVQQALIEVGGFSPERVQLLKDPDTTELRAQLRRLADRVRSAGDDALVLFYYSGHADAQHLHLRGLPMQWDELTLTLRDLPARVKVGLFDACRSGSVLGTKGGGPVAAFEVKAEEPVTGFALLTSSGADELSQETRTLQGSVFTHHFVSGLKGAADLNHDGAVTLAEAYQYSFERTQADTAATAVPQRPAFRVELKGQGELVLARLTTATAGVVLPKGETRRYVVTDALEWRLIAEGRSAPDGDVTLALKPGDYKVKRVLNETLEVAAISVKGGMVSVSALRFEPQPLSTGFIKGRPLTTDPDEVREYRRSEALRLLDQGETTSARALFDEILKGRPDDVGAQRGKARTLVRDAEAFERVGDYASELDALKGALHVEPTLSEDPDFARWYRRMVELEGSAKREKAIDKSVEKELEDNPRLKKRWGIGMEFIGTKGIIVVEGEVFVIAHKVSVALGLSLIGPGVDLSVKYVPFGWKVSPWVQVGGFFNLSQFWTTGTQYFTVNNMKLSFGDIWSNMGHADIGIQYFGTLGFHIDAGIGIMVYPHPEGYVGVMPWPNISLGWFF